MTDLARLKAAEHQLQRLMDCSDKDALAHCLRMLALYVAAYKDHFGELDKAVFGSRLDQTDPDAQTIQLFETGLHEAIAMLNMVRMARSADDTKQWNQLVN